MEKNEMTEKLKKIKTEAADIFADEQKLKEMATRLWKTVEEVRERGKDTILLLNGLITEDLAELANSLNGILGTRESQGREMKIVLWLSKFPPEKYVAEYTSIFEDQADKLAIMRLRKSGVITEAEYEVVALDSADLFEPPKRLFTISDKQGSYELKRKLAELRPGIQTEEHWKEYRIKFDAQRTKLFIDECVRNWLDGKMSRSYSNPLARADWQIKTLRNALWEKREKFWTQLVEISESEEWAKGIDLAPALAYLDSLGEIEIDASAYGTTISFAWPTRFPLHVTQALKKESNEKLRLSETALEGNMLLLGGQKIKLGNLESNIISALLECDVWQWLDFDVVAEFSGDDREYSDEKSYEKELNKKRDLQYYWAARRLNVKIYEKIGIKDFLEKTSNSLRISPNVAID